MTPERARRAELSSTDAAALLGLSRRTLLRIPRTELDYWETPGGGVRRHRRYARADLVRYAAEYLGLAVPEEDTHADGSST